MAWEAAVQPAHSLDRARQPAELLDLLPPRVRLAAYRRAVGQDFGCLEASGEVFICAARAAAVYDPDVRAGLESVAADLLERIEAAGGTPEDLVLAYASGAVFYDRADERLAAVAALEAAWRGSTAPHDHDRRHQVRLLRKRARRARRILDAALGAGRLGVSDDALDAWRDRRRAMAAGLVDAFGVKDADAVIAIQARQHRATIASHYVRALALRQIAHEEGLVCRLLTLTVPGHLHGRPIEAKAALEALWARLRARLAKVTVEEVVAIHDTRAAAWADTDALRASNDDPLIVYATPSKKRDGRFVVVRRHLVGRLTLGLACHDPHGDGTPHLHATLYLHPAAAEALAAILDDLAPAPQGDLVAIEDDQGEALNYCMKHLFATGADADRARCWASEMGVRSLSFLGFRSLSTVWQAVYTASNDDLTIERARLAKAAMRSREWGKAARILGMVRAGAVAPLRLLRGTVTTADGRTMERVIGVVDTTTGAVMEVGPRTESESKEDVDAAGVEYLVTAPANVPRGPIDPPDPDPDDWLEAAD